MRTLSSRLSIASEALYSLQTGPAVSEESLAECAHALSNCGLSLRQIAEALSAIRSQAPAHRHATWKQMPGLSHMTVARLLKRFPDVTLN